MRVTKKDGVYKATRVTGPSHNFLGLVLAAEAPDVVAVERCLLNADGGFPCAIEEASVLCWVQAGLHLANAEFDTAFEVRQLQFVPTDTPDEVAYVQLVRAIVEQARSDADEAAELTT